MPTRTSKIQEAGSKRQEERSGKLNQGINMKQRSIQIELIQIATMACYIGWILNYLNNIGMFYN